MVGIFAAVNTLSLPRLSQKQRKEVRELQRAAIREERRQFVVEGPHACADLAASGLYTDTVVIRDDASPSSWDLARTFMDAGVYVYASGAKDVDLMTDASSPQDIFAIVDFLDERPIGDRAILLDGVSDPGNVGTIIRTAAWFGFTDVVLGNGCADIYNPKVVRSSAGALFRCNVLRHTDLAALLAGTLTDRTVFATSAHGGAEPTVLHGNEHFALIIGSEAHGISADVARHVTRTITIPGGYGTESLNAAVAASILLYEAGTP